MVAILAEECSSSEQISRIDAARALPAAQGESHAEAELVPRTATRFQSTARGRAAHPGKHARRCAPTLKGLHGLPSECRGVGSGVVARSPCWGIEPRPDMKPFQGLLDQDGFGHPGCAARPWALLFNAVGVGSQAAESCLGLRAEPAPLHEPFSSQDNRELAVGAADGWGLQ